MIRTNAIAALLFANIAIGQMTGWNAWNKVAVTALGVAAIASVLDVIHRNRK